jgi:hypothetical protein
LIISCKFLRLIYDKTEFFCTSVCKIIFLRYHTRLEGRIITYREVESTIKKTRAKTYAKPPTSVEDLSNLLKQEEICNRYGMNAGEKFIHEIPSSSPRAGKSFICHTESAFLRAGDNIKAFADGTHKFFPEYFLQLFIIHVKIREFVSNIR